MKYEIYSFSSIKQEFVTKHVLRNVSMQLDPFTVLEMTRIRHLGNDTVIDHAPSRESNRI